MRFDLESGLTVKPTLLDLKWMHNPVNKILGVHFSYDKKGNDRLNFSLKLRSYKQNCIRGVLEVSCYLVES